MQRLQNTIFLQMVGIPRLFDIEMQTTGLLHLLDGAISHLFLILFPQLYFQLLNLRLHSLLLVFLHFLKYTIVSLLETDWATMGYVM